MDGSFDPKSNGSIERNIDARNDTKYDFEPVEENAENQAIDTSQSQSQSNLEASNQVETMSSLTEIYPFQTLYYRDTDEPQAFEDLFNKDVITEKNPKVITPSASYDDVKTPPIIDERNLRKLERLGAGSNGEVFKYSYSKDFEQRSELVAVKEEFGKKGDKNEKVVNEYLKLYDLNHEHIIKIIGIVPKKDSSDWVVMELGDCSLRNFLNDFKTYVPFKIPHRLCIDYFLQISRGMKEAHSKVIIYPAF